MNSEHDRSFSHPRSVTISASAMRLAREFAHSIHSLTNGSRVVAFNWADQVSECDGVDGAERQLGSCLVIGAYRRDEVPPEAVAMSDGVALTIHIPAYAWPAQAQRLIDVDNAKPFGLTLR